MRQLLRKNWDRLVMGGVLLGALILFILSGKDTYLAVPDNLELFQAQYQMLKNTGKELLIWRWLSDKLGLDENKGKACIWGTSPLDLAFCVR